MDGHLREFVEQNPQAFEKKSTPSRGPASVPTTHKKGEEPIRERYRNDLGLQDW